MQRPRGGGTATAWTCRRGRAGPARPRRRRGPRRGTRASDRHAASSPGVGSSTGASATACSSSATARGSESAGARSGSRGVVAGSRPALLPPGPRERAEHLVGIAGAVGTRPGPTAYGDRCHEVGPARRRPHRVGGRRAWSRPRRGPVGPDVGERPPGPRRPGRRTGSSGGRRSARASTLAASQARRAAPAPDQMAGSTTNRAVVGPVGERREQRRVVADPQVATEPHDRGHAIQRNGEVIRATAPDLDVTRPTGLGCREEIPD